MPSSKAVAVPVPKTRPPGVFQVPNVRPDFSAFLLEMAADIVAAEAPRRFGGWTLLADVKENWAFILATLERVDGRSVRGAFAQIVANRFGTAFKKVRACR